jgi:hypothetical protein
MPELPGPPQYGPDPTELAALAHALQCLGALLDPKNRVVALGGWVAAAVHSRCCGFEQRKTQLADKPGSGLPP